MSKGSGIWWRTPAVSGRVRQEERHKFKLVQVTKWGPGLPESRSEMVLKTNEQNKNREVGNFKKRNLKAVSQWAEESPALTMQYSEYAWGASGRSERVNASLKTNRMNCRSMGKVGMLGRQNEVMPGISLQWDDSEGQATCCHAWWSESNFQHPHGRQ